MTTLSKKWLNKGSVSSQVSVCERDNQQEQKYYIYTQGFIFFQDYAKGQGGFNLNLGDCAILAQVCQDLFLGIYRRTHNKCQQKYENSLIMSNSLKNLYMNKVIIFACLKTIPPWTNQLPTAKIKEILNQFDKSIIPI